MLNVLRGTAEFQINCLGLHGNDRTCTRDHGLLESLAAVDAALSEVVFSQGKSFFFLFFFFFFQTGGNLYEEEAARFDFIETAVRSRSLVSPFVADS